ncbi:hypothetical protein Tco_1011422 [Tanacetum coccineum]
MGRSCREELGAIAGVGIGVCCRCVMRGVGGGGRVVVDKTGGWAIVVTGTSISEVDSVLRLNIESIPVSGLGLSMLETKLDDTEELLRGASVISVSLPSRLTFMSLYNSFASSSSFVSSSSIYSPSTFAPCISSSLSSSSVDS